LTLAALGLIAGLGLLFVGRPVQASLAWTVRVVPILVALIVEIVRSPLKGEVGLDIVAALSMSAALLFDELTGESMPIRLGQDQDVMSGAARRACRR